MNYARARFSHPLAYSAVGFMADEMFVYIFDTFQKHIYLVSDPQYVFSNSVCAFLWDIFFSPATEYAFEYTY